jgi:uncharacterized protein
MKHSNRLSLETSPYLLQHAHNPVEWYAWNEQTLQKAKSENKPILVSIGYSACHWCHVMERECFENEQVAAVMNAHFICIKVDREERPDVDAVYMDALQAMGGQGGWPLNVFLMPDAKPFYGVTYLPPQNWTQLLLSIDNAFVNHKDDLVKSADGFVQNMQFSETQKYGLVGQQSGFTKSDLEPVFESLKRHFDLKKGGLDRAPKFVMPAIYRFLLRYYAISQNTEALKHIELSLNSIALGGIYDHVGGGWARYSVDDEWFIPHFEKMLYDNGQLLSIFSEGYTLTKSELYRDRVYRTIDWLKTEMTSPEGGFYSALDADSEGVEGKYYVWTAAELQSVLGDDYAAFAQIYNISKQGNWEHGLNHLHLHPDKSGGNSKSGGNLKNRENQIVVSDLPPDLSGGLQKLYNARQSRVRPGLDDKILASWNGLMLKGLVDAFRAFGDDYFREMAIKNANFLKYKMTNGSQLWHSYKDGRATITGFLEDYAAVIDGYIALYQITFDEIWLDEATALMAYSLENFFDDEDEFFFFTDKNSEALIARKKEIFDNVVPSSNSMMAHNLYLLGLLHDHTDYIELSDLMLSKLKKKLLSDSQWAMNWAALATLKASDTAEIVIVGPEREAFRRQFETRHYPNKIIVGADTNHDSKLPLLQDRRAINGQTTIYVCVGQMCQLPVFSVEKAWELLP